MLNFAEDNEKLLVTFDRIDAGDNNLAEHFSKANKNATYRSKTTQNALISLAGDQIFSSILIKAKEGSKLFSIQADELQDLSNREQMTICIRYVTSEGEIIALAHWRFIVIYGS